MDRRRLLILCAALLPAGLWAEDNPPDPPGPPPPPLTAKAIQEFAAGDKAAACRDALASLQQFPNDEKALGISKLACGEKAIDKMDLKKRPEKPEGEQKDDLKPKPFTGKANAPQPEPRPEGGPGGPPPGGENIPAQVIGAGPGGQGIREEPTTYDKLSEAHSLLSQGKPAEAAEAARRAVELQPRNRQAYDALAESYRLLRNYKQVLYVAELGLKTFPYDANLLKNKVFALNKAGDYQAAIETADQALAVLATDPVLHALKAYALGRSGDKAGMLKEMETAAALDPSFEPLLLDARRPTDGEPFLMPGDSRETRPQQKAPRLKRERPPLSGLLIFGGLIVLLLIILAVMGLTLIKKDDEAPPPQNQA